MLKITGQREAAPDSLSLILKGRLIGPWVEELNSYWCQMSLNQQNGAVIDLTGVTFIEVTARRSWPSCGNKAQNSTRQVV
jgi:hypothetical protein